jgi:hypothetical protein
LRHRGGGRPGKAPTFNWKQKKLLGLDGEKMKTFEESLKPMGNYSDIERFFDERAGDRKVELTSLENFEAESVQEEKVNDKKKVEVRSLFGSHKAFGMIEYPQKPKFKFIYRHRGKLAGESQATS